MDKTKSRPTSAINKKLIRPTTMLRFTAVLALLMALSAFYGAGYIFVTGERWWALFVAFLLCMTGAMQLMFVGANLFKIRKMKQDDQPRRNPSNDNGKGQPTDAASKGS